MVFGPFALSAGSFTRASSARSGFLGIAAATQRLNLTPTQRAQSAEGGMIGILAGATLLGVGGWPVPIALAAMVTAAAIVRVVRTTQTG